MTSKPDGGPAFPQPVHGDEYGDTRHTGIPGMTLRQWYAGQALAGNLAHPDSITDEKAHARFAFKIADAMIAHEAGEK